MILSIKVQLQCFTDPPQSKKKKKYKWSKSPTSPSTPPRNPAEKQAIDFITKQWITFFKFVCFWLNELLGWTSLHTADLRYASVWLCFMKTLVMLIIILIVVVIILYDKQFFASALTLVVIFFLFGNYRHNWCVLEVLFSVLDPYIYTRRQGNLSLSLSLSIYLSLWLSLFLCADWMWLTQIFKTLPDFFCNNSQAKNKTKQNKTKKKERFVFGWRLIRGPVWHVLLWLWWLSVQGGITANASPCVITGTYSHLQNKTKQKKKQKHAFIFIIGVIIYAAENKIRTLPWKHESWSHHISDVRTVNLQPFPEPLLFAPHGTRAF